MDCVTGLRAPKVGAVPIPKVSVLGAELSQPPTVEIINETVFEPPVVYVTCGATALEVAGVPPEKLQL